MNKPVNNYNLEELIKEVRRVYKKYGYESTCIPTLFNKGENNVYTMNMDFYNKVGFNKVLSIEEINDFLIGEKQGVIHICFAHSDYEGNISMANGETIKESDMKEDGFKFNEGNSFGINVKFFDDNYFFDFSEYRLNEETFAPEVEVIKVDTRLNELAEVFIEKFNK